MAGLTGLGGTEGSWSASTPTSQNKSWDWGAIATAAMQAVGQMSASSASNGESREQARERWAAELEQTRLQIAGQRDLVSQTRGYQLQDRQHNERRMGNYDRYYDGPRSKEPFYETTNTEPVNTPQTAGLALTTAAAKPTTAEAKPPKKPKKPSTLRRLLGGGIF